MQTDTFAPDRMRFDHLGLVVRDMAQGRAHLSATLGIKAWTEAFNDPVNGVIVQFGQGATGPCFELIAPLGPDSPIAKALAGGRAILNHVAYLVDDLDAAAAHMRAQRCMPAGPAKPAIAYGGARIQFFVTPLRYIVECIEAPGHRHAYGEAQAPGA